MRKYKQVMKDQLNDIVCDVCGKSCVKFNDDPGCAEYATLEAFWGYWSKKDGEKFHNDFCEECFDKILNFIKTLAK